jgi:hypothetical protein
VKDWRAIFLSHHPAATVESQKRSGPRGKRYYLVRTRSGAMYSGAGHTKPAAWRAACDLLRLDKMKTSTTR